MSTPTKQKRHGDRITRLEKRVVKVEQTLERGGLTRSEVRRVMAALDDLIETASQNLKPEARK